jgi:hypothetical protein
MKEQIKLLAKQADGVFIHKLITGAKQYTFLEKDLENFAQLIVRECIEKITTYDLVPGHSAKWEDIYDIHTRLLQDLGEELKEHFGIEE